MDPSQIDVEPPWQGLPDRASRSHRCPYSAAASVRARIRPVNTMDRIALRILPGTPPSPTASVGDAERVESSRPVTPSG